MKNSYSQLPDGLLAFDKTDKKSIVRGDYTLFAVVNKIPRCFACLGGLLITDVLSAFN